MRPNYIGIIGGILAFISLALPWWTMTISSGAMGITVSGDVSIYPYRASVSALGMAMDIPMEIWFGWIALALIILGGILGLVGSIIPTRGKMVLALGGVFALLSIIVFAVGLQTELSKGFGIPGTVTFPGIGLFSSGSFDIVSYGEITVTLSYSTYLSFGFWLALIAAIIMFVAMKKAAEAGPITPMAPVAPPPP